MPILGAFVVPHPPLIIPDVGRGGEKQIEKTICSYEKVADEIARLLYDRDTGLGLDIFRYNVGGGEKENPDSVEEQRNPGVFTLIRTRWRDYVFYCMWWFSLLRKYYMYTYYTYCTLSLCFFFPFFSRLLCTGSINIRAIWLKQVSR